MHSVRRTALRRWQVAHSQHTLLPMFYLPDQLFGMTAAIMLQQAHFQTPCEMLDCLRDRMRNRLERDGVVFHTQMLSAVRDYSRWLYPIQRTLHNGFASRGGIEAAHSYAYKPRALLSACERSQVPGASASDNTMDVFCSVKAYMRDLDLNQVPLLVLRPTEIQDVPGRLPPTVVPLRALSKERIETLLGLSDALQVPGQELPCAAAALKDLVFSNAFELMELPWLEHPRQVQVAEIHEMGGAPLFPHLPRTTWPLLIRRGATLPRREGEVEVPRP